MVLTILQASNFVQSVMIVALIKCWRSFPDHEVLAIERPKKDTFKWIDFHFFPAAVPL